MVFNNSGNWWTLDRSITHEKMKNGNNSVENEKEKTSITDSRSYIHDSKVKRYG